MCCQQLSTDCDQLLKLAAACDSALNKFETEWIDFNHWLTEAERTLRELQAEPAKHNTDYPSLTAQAKVIFLI